MCKGISLIPLVRKQDGNIENPSESGHPASRSTNLCNGVVDPENGADFEQTVPAHHVQVDHRESQKEVGPVKRLEGRLQG